MYITAITVRCTNGPIMDTAIEDFVEAQTACTVQVDKKFVPGTTLADWTFTSHFGENMALFCAELENELLGCS
jgi:hypothetical protein